MPQPRKYETNADRQAAYRARTPKKRVISASEAKHQIQELHKWIEAAADLGDVDARLALGASEIETVQNLIYRFRFGKKKRSFVDAL